MAKSKERLDAEKNHPMTGKEKVINFWFYYRWWVLGGGLALIMTFFLLRDVNSNVTPDYTLGLLTQRAVSEEVVAGMETAMLPYIDDRNGDGKTVVRLSQYNLTVGEEEPADPMAQMAGMTRLSGDIQMGESMLFITDNIEQYQKQLELFCYNDGSNPPEGGGADYSRMGVPLYSCPAFVGVDLAAAGQGEFVLVKRAIAPSQLERGKGQTEYHADSMKLFDSLTAK